MKQIILLFITVFICLSGFAQNGESGKKEKSSSVKFGFKGGFNSSLYIVNKFVIKDVTIDNIQNNYKVGYFGSLFMQINMKRHFIQPEISYAVGKSEIMFDKKGSQHPDITPDYASIGATIHTAELAALYGYNFTLSGPYSMCFFVGPKVKYVWNDKCELDFVNFDQSNIEEKLYPINFSAVVGVGVKVSRIFFDFRYEAGVHNISKAVTYESVDAEGEVETSNIIFKRRNNILSFSLGFLF